MRNIKKYTSLLLAMGLLCGLATLTACKADAADKKETEAPQATAPVGTTAETLPSPFQNGEEIVLPEDVFDEEEQETEGVAVNDGTVPIFGTTTSYPNIPAAGACVYKYTASNAAVLKVTFPEGVRVEIRREDGVVCFDTDGDGVMEAEAAEGETLSVRVFYIDAAKSGVVEGGIRFEVNKK